jgi:hypothetical protein
MPAAIHGRPIARTFDRWDAGLDQHPSLIAQVARMAEVIARTVRRSRATAPAPRINQAVSLYTVV